MQPRFGNLTKLTAEPARRRLAMANARLKTTVAAPAAASVPQVLAELDTIGGPIAGVDMLRLLSVALPPRELVWWACLAGRDVAQVGEAPPPLAAAEAWVFEPGDERRAAARAAMEIAEPDDDTTLCAFCAVVAEGTLGPGDLARYDAPPGAAENAAFGINIVALSRQGWSMEEGLAYLLDRGLDIARGGDGTKVPRPQKASAEGSAETAQGAGAAP
ncbi:DUF6931 family protein [Rhodosalinus sp.]|uniref:DUF6931 family protein n=1 Tax=Rhodosalinus sp. TaxID=2047741 RepID=UPI003978CC56